MKKVGIIGSGNVGQALAKGFVEMQAAQGNGSLYNDFYNNKPMLGKIKLTDFAKCHGGSRFR